ncbi:MAG: hypothetical protein LBH56_04915 [Coriobacteriales bacterium]|nr:hypothetical protein [Coriobacteriales bacterium]
MRQVTTATPVVAKQSTLQITVPPQPTIPPQPATPPRPATPAWMAAWLGIQPSELIWTVPQAIYESSTPSFMRQRANNGA